MSKELVRQETRVGSIKAFRYVEREVEPEPAEPSREYPKLNANDGVMIATAMDAMTTYHEVGECSLPTADEECFSLPPCGSSIGSVFSRLAEVDVAWSTPRPANTYPLITWKWVRKLFGIPPLDKS